MLVSGRRLQVSIDYHEAFSIFTMPTISMAVQLHVAVRFPLTRGRPLLAWACARCCMICTYTLIGSAHAVLSKSANYSKIAIKKLIAQLQCSLWDFCVETK